MFKFKRAAIIFLFAMLICCWQLVEFIRQRQLSSERREREYALNLPLISLRAHSSRPFSQLVCHIQTPATPQQQHNLTIVTQYFRLSNSKHGHLNYANWIGTFFRSVQSAPVIVYTDNESIVDLMEMRQTNNVHFIVMDSVWSAMRQLEIERNKSYIDAYIRTQTRLDPERLEHTANLYAIWNVKCFLMVRTIELNCFGSNFFIYTDIGAFRAVALDDWPDTRFVDELKAYLNDRALLGQIYRTRGDLSSSMTPFIQGGFFAGSSRALRSLHDAYYALHDAYYALHDKLIDENEFVGKDQRILNLLTTHLEHRRSLVRLNPPFNFFKCIQNKDKWFFYQSYLSRQSDKCSKNFNRLTSQFLIEEN